MALQWSTLKTRIKFLLECDRKFLFAMVTTLLYLFTFTSWSLGLFAALSALLMKLQEHGVKINAAQVAIQNALGAKRPTRTSTPEIPDELRKLMESSPNHPEVSEIEGSDEVIGVLFKAQSYPPSLDDDDDDSTEE